jgi:hypothetical protein
MARFFAMADDDFHAGASDGFLREPPRISFRDYARDSVPPILVGKFPSWHALVKDGLEVH